ncbi:MAG TPA: META domain-containing protein [Niabella sp.]|nr:META domain-containing protein [Niabella sp.]HQW13915.1 META domain-containing protein [Niabella sp.]HQX19192.1 META domain-containing protein [Niabella sp.]HQX41330.1 META domain-containing protein [Niabella sp.]HRB06254.1 META domain-containing protein [Niabella sp.]
MKKLFFLSMVLVSLISCTASKKSTTQPLEGSWELEYITGPRIAFEGLYPEKKPTITFNAKEKRVNGHSSCNVYNGAYTLKGNKIKFDQVASTMMACPGNGESVYYSTLDKATSYSIKDGKLHLIMDDVVMMTFKKL